MKITHGFSQFLTTNKNIITIGTFDGVHLGHQKVIEQLINNSKKENKSSLLLTFFPHPRMVLQKNSELKLINTIEEKSELLDKLDLDELIIQPFNHKFSRLSAFEFVRDVLVNQLNISKLIIGYDHRFGKNREGSFEQLQEYGELFGFEVEEISAQSLNDISISSTKIRKALDEGSIGIANNYLGYNFTLSGEIVKGNNLGSTIGFPTANINIKEAYKLIPKTGVYVVKSVIDDVLYYGMMNIGNRPTINGKHQTIEVNFFDLGDNLYGKNIQVELLRFLRDEQKFDSIDDLKSQLYQDKKDAKKIISENFQ